MATSTRVNLFLPLEIITEILSYLPAKSLGRCKCVSKPWRTLISNPQFTKYHLTKQTLYHRKAILVAESDDKGSRSLYSVELDRNNDDAFATKLSLDYPDNWSEVLGSCDGLILVEHFELGAILLLNPTTLESKEVSNSPFALDPSSSYVSYGFGYDSCSDDYKIVTISYSYDNYRDYYIDCDMFVNVYMVKRNLWKKVQNSPYDHSLYEPRSGVFVNGCLHWHAIRLDDKISPVLASFNLAHEKFSEVPSPSEIFKEDYHRITALGGCLCSLNQQINSTHIDIWMLKEYGVEDSWTKIWTVACDVSTTPIGLLGHRKVLLETDERGLFTCNVEEGSVKVTEIHGIQSHYGAWSYVESLVSPNCKNAMGQAPEPRVEFEDRSNLWVTN